MKRFAQAVIFCFVAMLFFLVSAYPSYAWTTINRAIYVYLTNLDQAYTVEMMIPVASAPTLDQEEIDLLVPEAYDRTLFQEAFNGYQDNEGYASYRLYSGKNPTLTIYNNQTICFSVDESLETPFLFKIAIIQDDGTLVTSSILTQTKVVGEISIQDSLFSFTEREYYPPVLDIPGPSSDYIWMQIWTTVLGILVMIGIEFALGRIFHFQSKRFFILLIVMTFVFYVISGFLQWYRDESMFSEISLFLPYLIILFVAIVTSVSAGVLAKVFPNRNPLHLLGYVILSNALLIVVSIYANASALFYLLL